MTLRKSVPKPPSVSQPISTKGQPRKYPLPEKLTAHRLAIARVFALYEPGSFYPGYPPDRTVPQYDQAVASRRDPENDRQSRASLGMNTSGSLGLFVAISQPCSGVFFSVWVADYKLLTLPKCVTFGERALGVLPSNRLIQTVSDRGSTLAPPLLTTR
jgi:hypothetical protein